MASPPPTKHGELGPVSDDDGYSSDSTITQQLLAKENGLDMLNTEDLESQRHADSKETVSGKHAVEYSVPARTKYIFLGLYFALNLSLTLFNKAVLGKVCLRFTARCDRDVIANYNKSFLFHGCSPPLTQVLPLLVAPSCSGAVIFS